ncbi:MAG: hypothetical protein IJK93_06725 [Muribaculaceae bacterium]|nr:hypothetical protein [Muribaculaceae bacterium]
MKFLLRGTCIIADMDQASCPFRTLAWSLTWIWAFCPNDLYKVTAAPIRQDTLPTPFIG